MPISDSERAAISAEPLDIRENPDGSLTVFGRAVVAARITTTQAEPGKKEQ
jgi:hypothetical protein